jgi:ABC-2 type transport system permease protein
MRVVVAQLRVELLVLSRNVESLLLTIGIPVLLLVFFSGVEVLPIDGAPVDFLAPGVIALAVMSTALVNLAIATGFEREYGILKRLGATPLGRPRLLAAKTLAVLAVQVLQITALWGLALALNWEPEARLPAFAAAVVLSTAAFAGLGLCLAGTLRALTTLAAANGLYLVLLLVSGMVIPLDELPGAVASAARLLPSGAAAEAIRGSLAEGAAVTGRTWVVLAVWAIAAPLAATRLFRWE